MFLNHMLYKIYVLIQQFLCEWWKRVLEDFCFGISLQEVERSSPPGVTTISARHHSRKREGGLTHPVEISQYICQTAT